MRFGRKICAYDPRYKVENNVREWRFSMLAGAWPESVFWKWSRAIFCGYRRVRGQLCICHAICLSDKPVGDGAGKLPIQRFSIGWITPGDHRLDCLFIVCALVLRHLRAGALSRKPSHAAPLSIFARKRTCVLTI